MAVVHRDEPGGGVRSTQASTSARGTVSSRRPAMTSAGTVTTGKAGRAAAASKKGQAMRRSVPVTWWWTASPSVRQA